MFSKDFPRYTPVGEKALDSYRIIPLAQDGEGMRIRFESSGQSQELVIPLVGRAALENFSLALSVAHYLGLSQEALLPQLRKISSVRMRCEIITDNPDITVINDSYNSDLESARTALHLLNDIETHPNKALVLTDMQQQGYIQ